MIEQTCNILIHISVTLVVVVMSICLAYYMPSFFKEWYSEMVNRHNHYRRRREICYGKEKHHVDELMEKIDMDRYNKVFGDLDDR